MAHRDTIVIGASSGGVQALRELLARLPVDLPAAVFVVQHQSAVLGRLASVLDSATKLRIVPVESKHAIHEGRVYLAQPDLHMVLADGKVSATRGARENRARPSINVLFRTAAAERSGRVIAVLLTGLLDDGVAGLDAVKRCGGVAIVQDPEDAEFPDLPRNALDGVDVDHVLPLDRIASKLEELASEAAPACDVPEDIVIEAQLSGPGRSRAPQVNAIGEHVSLACPECGGPLWKLGHGGAAVYRCHTGHALSARALLDSQAEEIERSLWAAVRALTERAATLERLAENVDARHARTIAGFRERAAEAQVQSEQARQFLLSLRMTQTDDDKKTRRDTS